MLQMCTHMILCDQLQNSSWQKVIYKTNTIKSWLNYFKKPQNDIYWNV